MKERLRKTDAAVLKKTLADIEGLRELITSTKNERLQLSAEKRLKALEKDVQRLRDALSR